MKLKVDIPLDTGFRPIVLEIRRMQEEVEKSGGQDIVIGVERTNNAIFVYKTKIFKDDAGRDADNFKFIERLVKSILWVAGGFRIIIAGSEKVGKYIHLLPESLLGACSYFEEIEDHPNYYTWTWGE